MHSTIHCQQPPVIQILSCFSWLQQSHIKERQVINDVLEPGGASSLWVFSRAMAWAPREFSLCLPSHAYEPCTQTMRDIKMSNTEQMKNHLLTFDRCMSISLNYRLQTTDCLHNKITETTSNNIVACFNLNDL